MPALLVVAQGGCMHRNNQQLISGSHHCKKCKAENHHKSV